MKKIMLICVSSQNVLTFRRSLIETLKANGYEVSVVAFDGEYEEQIKALGVEFRVIGDSNRSLNPFKALSLKKRYKKIINELSPDVVFTFMLKPNTFGVLAARAAGVKVIYSMVEGIGDVFINNSMKWKLVRCAVSFLYKRSLKHSKKVFFLNPDDKNEFLTRKFVREEQVVSLSGIGVDLERFDSREVKNENVFLMIARMLRTKGIFEYCECARRVRAVRPDARFDYLGGEGNVTLADIKEYIDDGSVNYLGTTSDVRPYLEDATFLILPSYREGCPVSVMEAEAIGRGIITTTNPGCKETVIDGVNGFLVEGKNVDAMVEKCIYVLDNPTEARKMCEESRRFAEEHFDKDKINKQILEVVEQ